MSLPDKTAGQHRYVVTGMWVLDDETENEEGTIRLDDDNLIQIHVVCVDCHLPRGMARGTCYARPSQWWTPPKPADASSDTMPHDENVDAEQS